MSCRRILLELGNKWKLLVALTALLICFFAAFSFFSNNKLEEDTYYFDTIDIIIHTQSGDSLVDSIKDVITSRNFSNAVLENQNIEFNINNYPHFVVKETSATKDTSVIEVMYTAKTKALADNMKKAIVVTGDETFENLLHENVDVICSDDLKKVVINSSSDINSAMLYSDYINTRGLSKKNIIIWSILSMFISFAICVVYLTFSMKIRMISDIDENVSGGYYRKGKLVDFESFYATIIYKQASQMNTIPIITFNMSCDSKVIHPVFEYMNANKKQISCIKGEDIVYDIRELSNMHSTIYAFNLNHVLRESKDEFVFFEMRDLNDILNLLAVMNEDLFIIICVKKGKENLIKVKELYKKVFLEIKDSHRIFFIISD